MAGRQLAEQLITGTAHRQKSGLQNIDLIDFLLTGKPDTVIDLRAGNQQGVGFFPALFGHLFGVIECRQNESLRQYHTGSANRPGPRKRGMLISGGEANTERAAIMLLDEFRSGAIGRITLERVPQ